MDRARWTPTYVALGSNLAEPVQQVRRALVELSRLPKTQLICRSSLYQSQPMGPQTQPLFVNAVAVLVTQLDAQQLLTELQRIERSMGRQVSSERWGPRIIDLDLLMFGEVRCTEPTLQLPHPGMLLRNFVMVPLAEIAPHLAVANGSSAAAIAQKLGMDGLQRLPENGGA
jgi:2-amino-4-hydroxy-6-hydroxymethyldihydropteridine diphosphokinase